MPGRTIACVVPARLDSSRFPGKLLQPLAGVPVVVRTLRRAAEADCFDRVLCLTDSPEIAAAARAHGFEAMLAGAASNGTERIARSVRALGADLVVDLQGDEPLFPPEVLRELAAALLRHPGAVHVPVRAGDPSPEDLANPNRVKAALDAAGFIVDFHRGSPRAGAVAERLQMGAYGYSRDYLARYAALPPSPREIDESHELLRDLSLAPLRALESRLPSQAIDVPGDMEAALALLPGFAEAVRK